MCIFACISNSVQANAILDKFTNEIKHTKKNKKNGTHTNIHIILYTFSIV